MPIQSIEKGMTHGELKVLKSTLTDSHPLSLPPDSSDAAVAELHEMLLELRNFATNMLKGDPSPSIRNKGYMAGVMKSLQAQLQSLSLKARAVPANDADQHADAMGDFTGSLNSMTQQLIAAKKQLEEANQILKLSMDIDPLTGLYTFSFLMKTLEHEIERSRRYNEPLSIVLLDIENLKIINESYGYRVGDAVLETTAAFMRQILRPSDSAGRYSGGEFMLILPNTDRDGACALAQRIQSLIAASPCTESNINVMVSPGVARWDNDKMVDLIHEAESDLRTAKHKRKTRS
jgi:diguanylate cyclase (GGDEF)-like protein